MQRSRQLACECAERRNQAAVCRAVVEASSMPPCTKMPPAVSLSLAPSPIPQYAQLSVVHLPRHHPKTKAQRGKEYSPHINRRLRTSTAHNLGKTTQLRWPRSHPRRTTERSTSRRRASETSRRSASGRVVRQSESPSCAVAQRGLLRVLKSWCLARGAAAGLLLLRLLLRLLRLLGAVARHVVHRAHGCGRDRCWRGGMC